MNRIPITLLTGFLGSGKTTLLNRLLRDPAMRGAAVVINEVGAVGIDHHLVEEVAEDVVLLESGCLCCTVRGDLARSLRDLFQRRLRREIGALDRIIIETTGLADPAPVLHTLLYDFFLGERFQVDAVLCTIDAQHALAQVARHPEALRQIVMADRLLLTKSDIASAEQSQAARDLAQALNPAASLHDAQDSTTWLTTLSAYDPAARAEQVLDWLGAVANQREAERVKRQGVFGSYAAPVVDTLHEAGIQTEVLRFTQPWVWGDFVEALDILQSSLGPQLLRVKGLVNVAGQAGPRIIHAVGHERYPVQELPQWPDQDHSTRLVFIVDKVPRAALETAFSPNP